MTDLDKLAELAERCENAPHLSQQLDRDIWLAVVADPNQRELVQLGRSLHGDDEAEFRIARMMDGLSYTASLDAAMSLVPKGLFPLLDWSGVHCRLRARHAGQLRDVSGAHSLATTPALALAAASLRSLSIMKVGNTGETGRSSTDGEGR